MRTFCQLRPYRSSSKQVRITRCATFASCSSNPRADRCAVSTSIARRSSGSTRKRPAAIPIVSTTADVEPAFRVGTAAWSIPRDLRERFPAEGTRLERYATAFTCAEINSSFYRPHRRATYERWAASVPDDFAFALKLPKEITHTRRFAGCAEPLERFFDESAGLGAKRAVVLVQLPPSFAFDAALASAFFAELRERYDGGLACEPRHPTWFEPGAGALLGVHRIARVAADPAILPAAAEPGGWGGLRYYRLHGSPRTYWSAYEPERLAGFATSLRGHAAGAPVWCIFDNTAMDAATGNAFTLREMLRDGTSPPSAGGS